MEALRLVTRTFVCVIREPLGPHTGAIKTWTNDTSAPRLTHSSDPQLMVSVRPRNNPQLVRGVSSTHSCGRDFSLFVVLVCQRPYYEKRGHLRYPYFFFFSTSHPVWYKMARSCSVIFQQDSLAKCSARAPASTQWQLFLRAHTQVKKEKRSVGGVSAGLSIKPLQISVLTAHSFTSACVNWWFWNAGWINVVVVEGKGKGLKNHPWQMFHWMPPEFVLLTSVQPTSASPLSQVRSEVIIHAFENTLDLLFRLYCHKSHKLFLIADRMWCWRCSV